MFTLVLSSSEFTIKCSLRHFKSSNFNYRTKRWIYFFKYVFFIVLIALELLISRTLMGVKFIDLSFLYLKCMGISWSKISLFQCFRRYALPSSRCIQPNKFMLKVLLTCKFFKSRVNASLLASAALSLLWSSTYYFLLALFIFSFPFLIIPMIIIIIVNEFVISLWKVGQCWLVYDIVWK